MEESEPSSHSEDLSENDEDSAGISDEDDEEVAPPPEEQNLYALQPSPALKFCRAKVKAVLEEVVEKVLKDGEYNAETSIELTKRIADGVKAKIKNRGMSGRYKYVVQVVLMQNNGQGIGVGARNLWDRDIDNCVHNLYENASLYCLTMCFACYFY